MRRALIGCLLAVAVLTPSLANHPEEMPIRVAKEESLQPLQKVAIEFEVTAYTLAEDECGKAPSHPAYGITASGNRVVPWRTIAAGSGLPFGTKIYLPHFKDYPNKGVFIVEDRGGAIDATNIDVYFEDYQEAIKFGRRKLVGYIITSEEAMQKWTSYNRQ